MAAASVMCSMKKTMIHYLGALLFVSFLSFVPTACNAQLNDLLKKAQKTVAPVADGDISAGLKEALNFGINEAVQSLSAKNGYFESPYKILVPPEAQQVVSKVKMVPGFENVERDLVAKMNEGAELAAKKATPIFANAIKSMTIDDATGILMGEKDAATQYLERTTRAALYIEFNALDEVNAREYWRSVVNAYNNIPLVKKVNPELDDHVANKGLDGLFSLIRVKEEKIRTDASQRTTDLLRSVFAKQDKK